jgi:hypothetical protein
MCAIDIIINIITYNITLIMPASHGMKLSRGARSPCDILSQMQDDFFFTDFITPNQIEHLSPASSWGAVVWLEVDPSQVEPWLRKAQQQAKLGKTVVVLMPARTNTRAFHTYVLAHAKEVRFIEGRLKYAGRNKQAPFPSVVAIFGGGAGPLQHQQASILPAVSNALNVVTF